MSNNTQIEQARKRAQRMLTDAGIVVTHHEVENMEIVDFGLGQLDLQGLQIIIYVNNDRYCAKELILFPHQSCPEHRHPDRDNVSGKMETFRCRAGLVYLYIDGSRSSSIQSIVPQGSESYYTVFHEIILKPGEQYTIPKDTLHWFQAGKDGAIVSEFSSPSDDQSDVFTDPNIQRISQMN